MADIIKNGSFEYGTANSDGSRFIPDDWVVPTPAFSTRVPETCDDASDNSSSVRITYSNWENPNGTPNGLPSISIQQGIDLTEYTKELALDIEFNYSLAYNYYLTTSGELNVFLYKATSYDSDGLYSYDGSYFDYISSNTYKMSRESEYDMCWKSSHFIVTNLQPGFYILVFATPVAKDSQTGMFDSSYNFVLDKVSGEVTETGRQVIEYQNILKNGTFELQNESGFDDWFSHGIEVNVGFADAYGNTTDNLYGDYVCEARCNNLEDAKYYEQGLKQVLSVDTFCKMEVSLSFQQYQDYSFALSVYKLLEYFEYDEERPAPSGSTLPFYYVTDIAPYYQADIRAFSPSSTTFSYWEEFKGTFGAEPGDYLLIIYPGEETTVIDNVQVNIFTEQETGNDGSFEMPYTLEDGYFTSDGKCFLFYNENGTRTGFILRDENYYYCRSEVLILDEIYKNRYYHPDGRMAMAESFTYDGKLYTADALGNITLEENYVLNIEPYLDERMVYGPIDSLDIVVDNSATIYVRYLKQPTNVTPSVTSSNSSVVACTGLKPGTEYSVIELSGRSPGNATVTVNFVNQDGTTVSRKINVIVFPNEAHYTNPYEIFLRKSIVCALPGETVKLDFTTLPREAMGMAMFWSSTDPSVATVDQNGNVTANKVGNCIIQIYNHRLKQTRNCEFYVLEKAVYPQKIKWRSSAPESIQVGEEVRLPDYVLAEFNGYPNYVIQDGYWTSSNPSVLTVTEYGTMVGKSMGETVITFRTPQNLTLTNSKTIQVVAPQVPIERIELDVTSATLNPNETTSQGNLQIGYRLFPVNTSDTEVVWISSNPEVVSVIDGLVSIKKVVDTTQNVTITCISASNSSVYKTCLITLNPSEPYPYAVKTFTPRVTTVVDRAVNIEYEVDLCFSYSSNYRFSYGVDVTMDSGTEAQEGTYEIDHEEGSLIRFTSSVKGIYKIELRVQYIRDDLSYRPAVTIGRTYFYVEVGEQSTDLIFLDDLETVSTLSNGSYILRFFIRNNQNNSLSFALDVGGSGNWMPVVVDDCIYQGKEYNYIFGENMPIGTHVVRVRATDNSTKESIVSNVATLIVSGYDSDNRNALAVAKTTYDFAEYDVVTYLGTIVTDRRLYDSEELEFKTRYKTYCHCYYNLREILEVCVDHINQEIAASEGQMAMYSTGSVSVASYSVTNTNANYENVTNMDYYQNECIKQLMARVLELENKLSELTSNNN